MQWLVFTQQNEWSELGAPQVETLISPWKYCKEVSFCWSPDVLHNSAAQKHSWSTPWQLSCLILPGSHLCHFSSGSTSAELTTKHWRKQAETGKRHTWRWKKKNPILLSWSTVLSSACWILQGFSIGILHCFNIEPLLSYISQNH